MMSEILCKKKRESFEENLKKSIANPKELWKNLKNLGLPNKKCSTATSFVLEKDASLCFESKANAEIFKTFFSNVASELLKKFPSPPNKFSMQTVSDYYKNICKDKSFSLCDITRTIKSCRF